MTNPLEQIIARGNRPPLLPYETYRERSADATPNWLRLGDGTVISVIAGVGTYCTPTPALSSDDRLTGDAAHDYPGPYSAVEAWLAGHADPVRIDVDELRQYVTEHGGVTSAHAVEADARDAHEGTS